MTKKVRIVLPPRCLHSVGTLMGSEYSVKVNNIFKRQLKLLLTCEALFTILFFPNLNLHNEKMDFLFDDLHLVY